MNIHHHSLRKPLSFLAVLLLCTAMGSSPNTVGSPTAAAAALTTPLALSGGFTQVSAGQYHTCALKRDGSIACWGAAGFDMINPPNPNTGFTQVSAGWDFACARKGDGSIACWGWNDYGQVSPLPNPNTGFTQVSAGGMHACALKGDGSIACWGENGYGQANLPSTNTGFTQVSAGGTHTCALKSNGSIACWGDNDYGQTSPVPSSTSGYTQVSAGGTHTCALKGNSSIACWGENGYGQATPPSSNSGFTQVSAGYAHTCAVKSDGSIACWGSNSHSQRYLPNPNSAITQVSAGVTHTCVVKNDEAVTCWGDNQYDQAPWISLSPDMLGSIGYGDSYTQALTASGGLGGGPYSFDVVAGSLPPGLSISANGTLSGAPTEVESYTFTLRALDAIGYMGTRTYTQQIMRTPLNITANNTARDYGEANPAFTAAFVGLKNNDPISATYTTPALPTSLPDTYPIYLEVAGDPTLLDNYILTTAGATLTVRRAPLTVKPDDLTRPYGSDNPPLTYAFHGLKNGEGPEVVSGPPPELTTFALPASRPGDYPILIMGSLRADNYDILYAPGTLRIEGMQLFLPGVLR